MLIVTILFVILQIWFCFVLSSKICGEPSKVASLIIRGHNFRRGAWPWMVALFQIKNNEKKLFCGGVLIGKRKVLTAAHCIHEKYQRSRLARDFLVLAGAYDLSNHNEVGAYVTSPSEVIVHPDWNPNVMRYDADIAMIFLDDEVPITKFIQPICIEPINSESSVGIVTGWGRSEDYSKVHEYLPKQLRVPIWSNEYCFLESPVFAQLASMRTFCAGGRDNSGPCNGDSGGGLYIRKTDGVYYLKGIVSVALTKHGNCDISNFVLYTNIEKFIEWIENPEDTDLVNRLGHQLPIELSDKPRRVVGIKQLVHLLFVSLMVFVILKILFSLL